MSSFEENTRTAQGEGAGNEADSKRQGLVAAGGILGAIAASSCCILPLILFSLGVSGAWIGNLAALAPYQPIFVAGTLGLLGYGYCLAYWKQPKACIEGTACAKPLPNKTVKAALWVATLLVVAAMVFPFAAPLLLNS